MSLVLCFGEHTLLYSAVQEDFDTYCCCSPTEITEQIAQLACVMCHHLDWRKSVPLQLLIKQLDKQYCTGCVLYVEPITRYRSPIAAFKGEKLSAKDRQ